MKELQQDSGKKLASRLPSIDAFKLLAAFAVVYIHISGTDFGVGAFGQSQLALFLNMFTKIAVPFFFAVSGYFILRAVQNKDSKKVLKTISKLLILFLLSILLHIVFKITFNQPIILSPKIITSLLLFNDTEFIGPHLWFLAALIYIFIVYYFIVKLRISDRVIGTSAIVLFTLGLGIHTYATLTGWSFPSYRNFIFIGYPFFTLGYFIAKYTPQIQSIQKSKLYILLAASVLLYVIEYTLLSGGNFAGMGTKEYLFCISLPLVIASLLMLLIRVPHWLSNTPLPKLGRDYSLHIYIVHIIVLTIIIEFVMKYAIKINSPLDVLLVAFICAILSLLIAVAYVHSKDYLKSFWRALLLIGKSFFRNYWIALIAGFIGLLFFGYLFGFSIINPQNDAWIANLSGDMSQHYLGWLYFRDSLWHLPTIGHIDNLPMPSGTSIVFLDSIPLFALIFKFFSGVLPQTFQYFGLFTAMSFVLQGVLGALILARFTKNRWAILAGSIFFIVSPILISRAFAHTALTAHWLILLAILLLIYFSQRPVRLRFQVAAWSVTMALAVLIHPYFVPIIGVILLLSAINQYVRPVRSLVYLGVPAFVALCILWALGGLSGTTSSAASGLGLYSSNLLSLVTPLGYSSIFSIKIDTLQWEGLGYLGLGLILFTTSLYVLLLRKLGSKSYSISQLKAKIRHLLVSKKILYFAVILGALLFALGPIIHFGNWLIVELPLPNVIERLWGTFRSTGRIFWPLYYLVMAGIVVYLLKNPVKLRAPFFAIFVASILLVQVVDIARSPSALQKKHNVATSLAHQSNDNLNSYFIGTFCNNERVVILDDNLEVGIELFHELPEFLIACTPPVSNGYFARPPAESILAYARDQRSFILTQSKPLPKDTLYLTRSKEFADEVRETGKYTLEQIDAYWILTTK